MVLRQLNGRPACPGKCMHAKCMEEFAWRSLGAGNQITRRQAGQTCAPLAIERRPPELGWKPLTGAPQYVQADFAVCAPAAAVDTPIGVAVVVIRLRSGLTAVKVFDAVPVGVHTRGGGWSSPLERSQA
jgi:hypothetical protein